MVNLEWYRSFVAVFQSGTVTAAAGRRFMTQPALSQHIAALEQALKTPLFERSARRMVPTDAARQLYQKIIGSIERLEAAGRGSFSHGDTPQLRLGAPITYFRDRVLGRFTHEWLQQLRLQLLFGEAATLIEKLQNDELDLVFSNQKISRPRLHYIFLENETFSLVLPKALKPEVDDIRDRQRLEDWLTQQRWISYADELPIIRRYWQTVFKKRPEFEACLVIPDLHTILQSVALGMGISILPDYLLSAAHAKSAVHVPWRADVEVSNALYLVCRQERVREPLIADTISKITS